MNSPQKGVNRRQFLGHSAQRAAGVAVGVASLAASASAGLAFPSDRLRVGVIGVRNQGKLLTGELAKFSDVDVCTLCDVDESLFDPAIRLVTEAGRPAPTVEGDFRRLLDERSIDAVVIATPDHWHAEIEMLACQAGKDVYLESPASHLVA